MDPSEDLKKRLQQLEQNMGTHSNSPSHTPNPTDSPNSTEFPVTPGAVMGWLGSLVAWVNSLSGTTRIVAIVGLGIVAFMILNFLFRIVTAIISLGIMALVVFVVYKLFFAKGSDTPPTPPLR